MASLNKVFLMGNLTRDLELRYTQGGTAVADMGLAINRVIKEKKETTFVDITLWGRTAEVACEFLKKGSPIHIEGRLQYDTWEKDGQKRSKLFVVAERIEFIGAKEGNAEVKVTPHVDGDDTYTPF